MSYTTINIKIHTIKCYRFLTATCSGRPCDHHQANFNRSCAFKVLTKKNYLLMKLKVIQLYANARKRKIQI